MSASILIVEDEQAIADSVAYALEAEGFRADVLSGGDHVLERARREHYDLIVLGLLLPGVAGLDLCRQLRAESDVPVVILTVKEEESDRVAGLEAGADDYVTKPFSVMEVVSRVRAILRRRELDRASAGTPVEVGDLRIDLARHAVEVGGAQVRLTPSEFRLLTLLASRPGEPWTRREIMQHLWQSEYVGDEHACDVHVSNLRHKIERDSSSPQRIQTVRGVGYRLVAV
jgi:two-component system response regulator RegX3